MTQITSGGTWPTFTIMLFALASWLSAKWHPPPSFQFLTTSISRGRPGTSTPYRKFIHDLNSAGLMRAKDIGPRKTSVGLRTLLRTRGPSNSSINLQENKAFHHLTDVDGKEAHRNVSAVVCNAPSTLCFFQWTHKKCFQCKTKRELASQSLLLAFS